MLKKEAFYWDKTAFHHPCFPSLLLLHFLITSLQEGPLTFLPSKMKHFFPIRIFLYFWRQSVRLMLLFSGWINAYTCSVLNADAVLQCHVAF